MTERHGSQETSEPVGRVSRLIRRGWFPAAVILIAIATTAHLLYYLPRTIDDMFIYLRYAENLAAGKGAVYNPGERVEGFSSPLWLALLWVGARLGIGGVSYSKLLAMVSVVGLLMGLYRLARAHLGVGRGPALLVLVCVVFNSYVVSWTLWGLETPAYLALIIWGAVLMDRYLRAPSRRTGGMLAVVLAAGVLSRPEAGLFVALVCLALVLQPLRLRAVVRRLRTVLVPGLIAASIVGAYVVFRRLYFGLWLPHTYYAKSEAGFDTERWAVLWSKGALTSEIGFMLLAAVAALAMLARRRSLVPVFVTGGVLVFTGSVIVDWMPNIRHFLLVWLMAPLALAWGVDRAVALWQNKPSRAALRWVGAGMALVIASWMVFTAAQQVQFDARYSENDFKTHGKKQKWFVVKSRNKWRDTWQCLNHVVPDHVRAMPRFSMGMITQLYRLLEADDRPLNEVWYVGRDIGRVGYLSPVNVFDTDGLFTPAVVRDTAWQAKGAVSEKLIEWAFDRPVVATELVGPWPRAIIRHKRLLKAYEPRSKKDKSHWRFKESVKPSKAEIVRRYRHALSKLPTAYFTMTLYGEAVGAALEKRTRIVEGKER